MSKTQTQNKFQEIQIKDFLFKVSEDRLELFLEISENKELLNSFYDNWEEIKNELSKERIFGILETPEISENKIIVAKGSPPHPYVPERIELSEKIAKYLGSEPALSKEGSPTSEEEKGIRDSIQKILCVEKEETIGIWYPPIPGIDGIDVLGEPIPHPLKERVTITLGKNLFIDEEKKIKAKEGGVILLQQNTLEIFPEFVLKGDVDFSTGNINFIGKKLTIQGDIKFGFKVKVKGDLELSGTTENKVSIEVDGNFRCDGIIRGEDTTVKVSGNAEIKGIEYAKVEIKGNLSVRDHIIFSKMIVNGNLINTSGRGILYGGIVKCCDNIEVKTLGNETFTLTQIFAGYNPSLVEKYFSLLQKSVLLEETINKLETGIKLGEKLKKEERLTKEKEEILNKLKAQHQLYLEERDRLIYEIKDLKKELINFRGKFIKVLEKIYPGVIIGIAEVTQKIEEEVKGPIVFYLEESKIKFEKS